MFTILKNAVSHTAACFEPEVKKGLK